MPDFGPNNFLREVKQTTTGSNLGTNCDGGFLRDIDVTPQFTSYSIVTTLSGSTGAYGSNSTSPLATGVATSVLTPNLALLTSTGASTFGPFQVHRAYDQTSDQFQLRISGSTAGTGQSTITLYGQLNIMSTGATSVATSAVASAPTTVNNGQFSNIGWGIQGAGLQYPDSFTITMSTSGGNYQVISVVEVISDCLVAWNDYGPAGGSGTAYEFVGGSTQQIRTA
jgi:hypothetical protein